MASIANSQDQLQYDLFIFGDSLSDIGNLYQKTNGQVPLSPPYFDGRFSNGAVAVETLTQQLGLPISLTTNFAIGGARTDRTNLADIASINFKPGGLLDEIDQFKANASQLGAGAEDIYLVWAGANDFLKLLDTPPADSTTLITDAINNIVSSVTTLIGSGAKNILVAELPNLGLTPLVARQGQAQALAITQLTQKFNTDLATALNNLESASPNRNIILSDTFKVSNDIAANPSAYGFTNITDPLIQNLTAANPSGYFFWDDFHPTTQGHSIFAQTFRNDLITGITDAITRNGTNQDDRLVSFGGRDVLDGKAGADYLESNGGRDRLLGGAGNDTLIGGDNRDRITGGLGKDILQGGTGRDRFIYTSIQEGRDRIEDFEVGKDRIDLRGILNKRDYNCPNLFSSYVRLTEVSQGTIVKVSTNGDVLGDFTPLALLSGVSATELKRSSFILRGVESK